MKKRRERNKMSHQSSIASIKEWPESDRPREKFTRLGPSALTDSELIAILLRNGQSNKGSALDQARRLLERFGGLRPLSEASLGELRLVEGIGPVKAITLKTAFEVARRGDLETGEKSGRPIGSSQEVYDRFGRKLETEMAECFKVLLLDTKNRPIREVSVAQGALNTCAVHAREVFQAAVKEAAASVIFMHNHPSGDPEPSFQDRQVTERLVEAGALMGIRSLDHVVVGKGSYVSFRDREWM